MRDCTSVVITEFCSGRSHTETSVCEPTIHGYGNNRSDQSASFGLTGGLAPIRHAKLVQDVCDVGVDGAIAQEEIIGDLAVGLVRDEQA